MRRIINLTGQKFGCLTVISRSVDHIQPSGTKRAKWLCRCECGNNVEVTGINLRRGKTKSCGCITKDLNRRRRGTFHGESHTKLYHVWSQMIQRCTNPKQKKYPIYGGRGITVCEEWKYSYLRFRNWAMTNGYAEGLSIDRIDVDGNYEPSNCRWATSLEQAANKRK